jgi:Mn-dependent DtxR family transcriptional regulator
MDPLIGFLKADKHKLRVLEVLRSNATPEEISHKLRLAKPRVEGSIRELEKKGLIKLEKNGYTLTPEGLKILGKISSQW